MPPSTSRSPVGITPPVIHTRISFPYKRRFIISATDSVVKQHTPLSLSLSLTHSVIISLLQKTYYAARDFIYLQANPETFRVKDQAWNNLYIDYLHDSNVREVAA